MALRRLHATTLSVLLSLAVTPTAHSQVSRWLMSPGTAQKPAAPSLPMPGQPLLRPKSANGIFTSSGSTCAITQCDPHAYCRTNSLAACFVQTCPETAWLACVVDSGKKGLEIGPVYLKRTPAETWMSVVYEAGLTELLVPYHLGNTDTTHLHDMQFCGHCMAEVTANDAGRDGFVATLSGDTAPRLVVEARDRGVAWLCKSPKGSMTRRGEEMVLWSVYDTGNYEYMIQYGFQDDGVITFRVGATGYNNPKPDKTGMSPSGTLSDVAHMHTALWRLDLDLDRSIPNTVKMFTHSEPSGSLSATDTDLPFNFGLEGFMQWDPLAFNSLVVENSHVLNAHGHPIGYELVPLRTGTARHYGFGESFTKGDFWVTIYHSTEAGYSAPFDWRTSGAAPDSYLLPNATQNPESVVDNDVILWYLSSVHHDPHDEDHAPSDTTAEFKGLTLTHWLGFDLVPHNLFDYNPLGGPHRDQCDGDP